MSNSGHAIVDQLCHHTLSLRAQLDQVEARVPDINNAIGELAKMLVLKETAVLGLVIYEGHYSDHPGSAKSTNVVQAALMIPKGFGVIWWEAKEYLAYRKSPPTSESDCQFRFVPFLECPSAIRTLLLPQVHPLLVMLLSQMRAARPPQN